MLYQTYVQIHTGNIRDNIQAIQKRIGKDRKTLIAIKANAYGHGAVEIARMAEKIGVEWMGVATVPEGIALREAGITARILKFGPGFQDAIPAAFEHDITLSICDQQNAETLQKIAAEMEKKVKFHLKVDTGMGRIGVSIDEAGDLAGFIDQNCPNLELEGIYTHLPISDIADPTYTQAQIARFKGVIENVEKRLGREIELTHCANSGAVLGHEEGWLKMVRPGIMIYGYYPDKTTPRTIALKPGLSFYTSVIFIKKVKAGTSIGYGRTWIAPQDTWIATIPVGYADGFNRLFSNMGRVLINGRSYPIVGRICMDQCMVDLGPETDVKVEDQVVLIGRSGEEEITCDELADKLGTITYEVTCQINSRVTRYYDEI